MLSDVFRRYFQEHGSNVASATSVRRHLELVLENVDGDPVVSEFGIRLQERTVDRLRRAGFAVGAIKRIMTSAKAATIWAWKQEIITSHPAFLSLPDGEPRDRVLSIDEIAALWDAADQAHLQAFLIAMLCTGARPNSILSLTVFQCDFERGLIDLHPPGKARTKKRAPVIPMASCLRPWLVEAKGHFVEYRGRPLTKINSAWRSAREAAGLGADVVPYAIRHTVATEMRSRGVPELEIAGLLGHNMPNFRTTGRYAKYAPEYLSQARQAIDEFVREIDRAATRSINPNNKVRSRCVPVNYVEGQETLGKTGAGDGIRTHDPNLGKVVLYH